MTLVIELTQEQEARLQAEAEAQGIPLQKLAMQKLTEGGQRPKTGAEIARRLRADASPSVYARYEEEATVLSRRIREEVERRER